MKKDTKEKSERTSNKTMAKSITKDSIRTICERRFSSGLKFTQRDILFMIPEDRPNQVPRYFDDPSISKVERDEIEWMAGLEVHLHKNIVAFYGRNCKDHRIKYLGPILSMLNTPQGYIAFKEDIANLNIKMNRVLMETTGIYHFPVYWFLKETYPKLSVIAMNAGDIKRHMPKVSKNDKADAVRIAQVAHMDELIKSSHVPSKERFALRELMRQRDNIIQSIVKQKNIIKKMFSSFGFTYVFSFNNEWEMEILHTFLKIGGNLGNILKMNRTNPFVKKNMRKFDIWMDFALPEMVRANLLLIFGLLTQQEMNLKMIESALVNRIESDAKLKHQMSLLEDCTGIGYFSAACILLESGDIHRFRSVSHYISYIGIGPTSATSGYENPDDTAEKTVEKPRPNRLSNHHLKRIYIAATGSIRKAAAAANAGTNPDDMIRYASKFKNEKLPPLKIKFKIAAKLARKIYNCLFKNISYVPDAEFQCIIAQNQNGSKSKISRIPKRKRQAWTYKRVTLIRQTISEILTRLDGFMSTPDELEKVKEDFRAFLILSRVPDMVEVNDGGEYE